MGAIEQALERIVERAAGGDGPGAILSVTAPTRGVDWRGAAGFFARGSNERLRATDGFRIASMSKTFTATVVMRLVESGRLALDARLAEFFPRDLVARVHPDAAAITLAHLLNHTAGLWDFALSNERRAEVMKDLGRFRPPQEILEWAIAHGAPVGPVGGGHVYSDTGYVLLGRILETVTGSTYAALCRSHIFDPLGMDETWLEGHEAPRSRLSHPYTGDLDGLRLHGSSDWAAGGHVSTTADLTRFLLALFRDRALVSDATLDRMLVSVKTPLHRYGLGVGIRREAAEGKPDTAQTFWGHSGYWGSFMLYAPALRGTITGTVNRAEQDNRWIFSAIVECLTETA